MKNLTKLVREEAIRQGFSLVGVVLPDSPKSFPVYKSWVDANYHGEMAYLATERALGRRRTPKLILPDFQSILVLGIHYSPPVNKKESEFGQIAAYASNLDYHEVLKPKLQAIVKFLEKETGKSLPNRWYTDTGPILERDLAQRAGLGWIGKNSMLIHPKVGSYFILAEIFLGIQLEPISSVIIDHCGTCNRCVQACPTYCILPERTLDASRCLSYLTIEKKGAIPPDLRSSVGNWIFGCDICQQVCPWNRFAPVDVDPSFSRPFESEQFVLETEFSLSPQEFNKKFKGSPIKRSKRRGYLRNVAVAIGNSKEADSIPALAKVLQEEEEPLIRQHATWALGQIGNQEALDLLQNAAKRELNEKVLEEIRDVLNNSFIK